MHPESVLTATLSLAGILCLCLSSGDVSVSALPQSNPESGAPQYDQAKECCLMTDRRVSESSGIALSIIHKDSFWTHNDSLNPASIFLFNRRCEMSAIVNIKDVQPSDWEDMASFKRGDVGYILIADTGDNFFIRKTSALYIIREPLVSKKSGQKEPVTLEVAPETILNFSFEDGPRNCESAAVDPAESIILLASKDAQKCTIYAMPLPSKAAKEPMIAKAIATLKLSNATAMDVSPDGLRAVILTYGDAYEFSKSKDETWAQAFTRTPRTIKAPPRRQGEAICYGSDGKTLYLTSEGVDQPLWEMPVRQNAK
jgi:hypothetical protein